MLIYTCCVYNSIFCVVKHIFYSCIFGCNFFYFAGYG